MNNLIIPQNNPNEHPLEFEGHATWGGPIAPGRKGQRHPDECDPGRRLIAAVACLAVLDLIRPPKTLDPWDQHSARKFITEYQDIYLALGIPAAKLETLVSDN
jgi:hypothetical protein